jgi:hypothetical protein
MVDEWMDDWNQNNNADQAKPSAFEQDYGLDGMRRIESQRERLITIPLEQISPDLRQPRRSLPHELREAWFNDPAAGGEIVADWHKRAIKEAEALGRATFDPVAFLTDEIELQESPLPGPIEERFIKLLSDARTAIPKGRIDNPVVVMRDGEFWLLESGERRTLMHWALTQWVDAETFSEIPARKTDALSALAQAAENSARQDLNAIEQARQLALVLLYFYPEMETRQYHESESDLDYYRQAVDLRTPRGESGTVMAATGLSSNRQISRYRALLGLPERVWDLADELNWSEGKIRTLVDQAGGMEIVDQLVHYAEIEAGLKEPDKAEPAFEEQAARMAESSVKTLRRVVNMKPEFKEALTPEERQSILALAQAILERFSEE